MVLGLTGQNVVEIIIRAKDEFSNVADGISGKLTSMRTGFIALTAVGTGISAIGIASLKTAADFEQSRIAFTTMLGDAEKANEFLKDLADFAKRTPFTLKGIENASRKLLAVGFAAEDVLPVMQDVGNIASGLGLGQEGLDRLILNLGQVQAQGKLTGRELRDFAVAGIPLLDELAKSLGKTPAEIQELVSAGEITTQMVLDAFDQMSSEGGRFADLMEKQMGSAAGQFSNLQDSVELLARELGAALIPIAKQILDIIIPIVTKVSEWTQEHPELTKWIVIVTGVLGGLALILGTLGLVMSFIIPGLVLLVSMFGAIAGVITFPLIAVIAGLVAVGVLLYKNWDVIKEKGMLVFDFLKNYFAPEIETLKLIVTLLGIAFKELWSNYIKPLWDNFRKFVDWIKDVAGKIIGDLLGKLGSVIGKISEGRAEQGRAIAATRSRITRVGDAIIRPNGQIIETDPRDTIIATKHGFGGGIVINIENIHGLDPEEISRALSNELNKKISL